MDREGHNFERTAIESWLSRSRECPIGREPLTVDQLFKNRALQEEIEEWRRGVAGPIYHANDGMATMTPPQVLCGPMLWPLFVCRSVRPPPPPPTQVPAPARMALFLALFVFHRIALSSHHVL